MAYTSENSIINELYSIYNLRIVNSCKIKVELIYKANECLILYATSGCPNMDIRSSGGLYLFTRYDISR